VNNSRPISGPSRRIVLLSLLALLLSVSTVQPLAAQPKTKASGSSDSIKIPFESYKLPNGLNVILSVDHSTPTVAVDVWYHVGSKNEVPGRTGFAHLFEHVMFTGSGMCPTGCTTNLRKAWAATTTARPQTTAPTISR